MRRPALRLAIALLLALAPALAWGQSVTINMAATGTRMVNLQPGTHYKILDPGGDGDYPSLCNSLCALQAPPDQHIRITGWVKTEEGAADYLAITDGTTTGTVPITYEGYSYVDFTSETDYVTLTFVSNLYLNYPGYCLSVMVVCDYEPEVFDIALNALSDQEATLSWEDHSLASEWTIHYGTDPFNAPFTATTSDHNATLTGLQPGTTYYYRVLNNHGDTRARLACLYQGRFSTPCNAVNEIVHDLSTGNAFLSSCGPCDRHVLTGTTSQYRAEVQRGFKGTIVLRDLNMPNHATDRSPIRIKGPELEANNFSPTTEVYLVLEGNNVIHNTHGDCACIQIDAGATLHISSVNPLDDYSGTLCLTTTGGAAIGSLENHNLNEGNGFTFTNYGLGRITAGGNVEISSGVVYAYGGHGAGIGGGHYNFYDGMILVRGGIVQCAAAYHAAGIGSGCPTGIGVVQECTPLSSIVALPPSRITATGAFEGGPVPDLGLAGTHSIFYMGDPNKPLITLSTGDSAAGADIYADLSQDPALRRTVLLLAPDMDVHRIYLGTTDSTGTLRIHALLPNSTTFFSDALTPGGLPYDPLSVDSLTSNSSLTLPVATHSFDVAVDTAADILSGFSASQALAGATAIILSNNSTGTITNLRFSLTTTQAFGELSFSTPAGAPLNAPPTELAVGESVVVRVPLLPGAHPGLHSALLQVTGRNGFSPLDVRLSLSQYVIRLTRVDICDSTIHTHTLPNGLVVTRDTLVVDNIPLTLPASSHTFECNGVTITDTVTHLSLHDSLLAYQVRFQPLLTDTLARTVCDSLHWNGQTYSTPGYHSTPVLTSPAGCDSVATLSLTLLSSTSRLDTLTLCTAAMPYTYNERTYTVDSTAGLHPYHLRNSIGCDSLYLLQLNVVERPDVQIGQPTNLCALQAFDLTATYQGDLLTWTADPPDPSLDGQEHQATIRVSPRETTVYTATASIVGLCDSSTSRSVSPYFTNIQAAVELNPSAVTFLRNEVRLTDRSRGHIDSRQWIVDNSLYSTEPSCLYYYPITQDSVPVTLIVADGIESPCRDTAHATIRLLVEGVIWVPNAFTPDEGINQRFVVKGNSLRDFELSIYNRQGQRVYYSVDMAEGWDGTCRGIPQPQGSYTYLIRYTTLDRPRDPQTLTGTVTLIR